MSVRIQASFPATDGLMPESIEIEADELPGEGVLDIIRTIATMPSLARELSYKSQETDVMQPYHDAVANLGRVQGMR